MVSCSGSAETQKQQQQQQQRGRRGGRVTVNNACCGRVRSTRNRGGSHRCLRDAKPQPCGIGIAPMLQSLPVSLTAPVSTTPRAWGGGGEIKERRSRCRFTVRYPHRASTFREEVLPACRALLLLARISQGRTRPSYRDSQADKLTVLNPLARVAADSENPQPRRRRYVNEQRQHYYPRDELDDGKR